MTAHAIVSLLTHTRCGGSLRGHEVPQRDSLRLQAHRVRTDRTGQGGAAPRVRAGWHQLSDGGNRPTGVHRNRSVLADLPAVVAPLMRYATESAGAVRPRYTCPRVVSVPSHGAPTVSAAHTRWRTAAGSKSSVVHAGRNASGQSSASSMSQRHAMAYGRLVRG